MPLLSCEEIAILDSGQFVNIFNTLFLLGGFARYSTTYGDLDCEKFLLDFETPRNHLIMQAICACRLMELLPRACHAILLLQPCRSSMSLSVSTWKMAERCCLRVFDIAVLVRAMRVFCSRKGGVVWEDFDEASIFVSRTRVEWVEFARSKFIDLCISSNWWCQTALRGVSMLDTILSEAKNEMDAMHTIIFDKLHNALMVGKQIVQDNKEMEESKKGETKKRKRRPLIVGKKEMETLLGNTNSEREKNMYVLRKLEQVLAAKKPTKLNTKLAGIVGALTRVYPLIKWNMKAVVQKGTVDHSTYATEKKLVQHQWDVKPSNALRMLEMMV